jgi:hypothetical protein
MVDINTTFRDVRNAMGDSQQKMSMMFVFLNKNLWFLFKKETEILLLQQKKLLTCFMTSKLSC